MLQHPRERNVSIFGLAIEILMNRAPRVEGDEITLKYKDGEKKIVVAPNTTIVTYVPADKSELKPGAKIFIAAANKKKGRHA